MIEREVIVVIKVYCGCGYETNYLPEAEEHCKETQHTMDITGKVFHNAPEPSPMTREA